MTVWQFDYIAKRGSFEQNMPLTWYVGVGGWVRVG